jgi:hypothetical protein
VRLWHRRADAHRSGPLAASDEEDCYSTLGRRRGIWLTDERLSGPDVVALELRGDLLEPFEITGDGDRHRTFIVPANVVADPTSRPTAAVKGATTSG